MNSTVDKDSAKKPKRSFGKKKKAELSVLEEEQMQSPYRTIIKNLTSNKLAMSGMIVFITIFLICFVMPFFFPLDLNYQDPTQQNIPPGFNIMKVPKSLANNAKQIDIGPTFGVGIDNNGVLYEWGNLSTKLKRLPANLGKVVEVSAGQDHIVALNENGELFTWGFDRLNVDKIPPELKGKKIKSIKAGFQVSMAVTEDGKIYKWGSDTGIDAVAFKAKDKNVKKVITNLQTAMALTEDGEIIPLAKKATAFDAVPEDIQGKVVDLAMTDKAAAAVTEDGTVTVWGGVDYGVQEVPAEIQGNVASLTAGRNHVVAITKDGKVVAWGGNNNGQSNVPSSLKNVSTIVSGYYQNYAIDESGNVTPWGLKGYLFGTDNLGRSIALRMLQGGRMTMTVGAIAVIISLVIGIIVGGISGYYGGTVDIILMRCAEIVGSLPFYPLALILSALIGNRISDTARIIMIMFILGFLGWTGIASLVRAQILAEREKEFVTAAKALGIKERNIIFRHIVPNVMTIIIVNATLSFATCMLTESGLSFLGFGVMEPSPSWGNMLNSCRSSIVIGSYWWRWVFPSLALALCTISINIFGDGLRNAVDPRSNER